MSASCSGDSCTLGEDVTRPPSKRSESRGIAHLLVGGKSFHGREEVENRARRSGGHRMA